MKNDSEYKQLRSVLLFIPDCSMDYENPPDVLHLRKVDFRLARKEFNKIAEAYEKNGIKVYFIDNSDIAAEDNRCQLNMMYVRDLFFMTLRGAVLAKMCHDIRSKEVKYARITMEKKGIPIVGAIDGDGTFEGADALWIDEDTVLVGVGKRTNESGFLQLKGILKKQDIRCDSVSLNADMPPQHLLGILQIVGRKTALIRVKYASESLVRYLINKGFDIIEVPENDEILNRQAMNIVTLSPMNVIMPTNCPLTRKLLKDNNIDVVVEVEISQLINGAGGIACATGILERSTG